MASWHLVAPDGTIVSGGAAFEPLLRLLPGGVLSPPSRVPLRGWPSAPTPSSPATAAVWAGW